MVAQALATDNAAKGEEDDEDIKHKNMNNILLGIQSSSLYLIGLPDLPRKTYGHLTKHFARDGIVVLGLLRGVFANMSYGPKANKMPYVYTNPDRESELFACDRAFVLSTVPMQANKLNVKVSFLHYTIKLVLL